MADETCSSEALISFLLEIGREEGVQKSNLKKKRGCDEFLSLFDHFDLEAFLVRLEGLVENHLRIAQDSSNSNFERSQELAFVIKIKLGTLRILEWLFPIENAKCRKFVTESGKLVEQVLKSGRLLDSEESSNLGSNRGRRRRAPRKPRKPRDPPGARVAEEAVEEGPDHLLEEPEIEECSFEDPMTSAIADNLEEEEVQPTMPLEVTEMDYEEEAPMAQTYDVGPSFQLEPLSDTESVVVYREPRRRKVIDRNTQLSDNAMKKNMLESSKLSKTVEENRAEIFDLCSKMPSASDLLRPGPCMERCEEMTKILTKWFKRPRLERSEAFDRMLADNNDDILHGLMQTTDDPDGISDARLMQNGDRGASPAQEISDLQDSAYFPPGADSPRSSLDQAMDPGEIPPGDHAFDSNTGSNFEDQLAEVHTIILRNANRVHRQGDFSLRYACLSEISSNVPKEEFPSLMKYMLFLYESGHLYITQPSLTRNQIFIFPRGQASDEAIRV